LLFITDSVDIDVDEDDFPPSNDLDEIDTEIDVSSITSDNEEINEEIKRYLSIYLSIM
jgi:hypothetical protein